MTGNQIGDEGAKAISELLKTSTSLNDLHVGSLEEIEKENGKERQETHGNGNGQIVGLEKKERNQ